jgi:hypothetical protein
MDVVKNRLYPPPPTPTYPSFALFNVVAYNFQKLQPIFFLTIGYLFLLTKRIRKRVKQTGASSAETIFNKQKQNGQAKQSFKDFNR